MNKNGEQGKNIILIFVLQTSRKRLQSVLFLSIIK
jgi:hypothetical protein